MSEDQDICKNCECPPHCTGNCPRCAEANVVCETCDCPDCDGSNIVR